MGKILLPQRLKYADGGGIAEVETPRLRADGDTDAAVIMRGQKFLRQALRFLSEEQIRAVGVIGLVVAAGGLGREQAHAGRLVLREEIRQILIHAHVDQMPVIESGTLHGLVRNVKAQRLYQMQDAARRSAGARDISGVGRNFRFYQYNMQHTKDSLPAVLRQASIFYDRTSQISTVFQKKISFYMKKISFCSA